MPSAIDDQMMSGKTFVREGREITPPIQIDPAKPPVISIPHMEYPRVVYLHPVEEFEVILHRNEKHEVVHEEIVPTQHESKLVQNDNELRAALKDGWVKEPYIPKAPPNPREKLYRKAPKAS